MDAPDSFFPEGKRTRNGRTAFSPFSFFGGSGGISRKNRKKCTPPSCRRPLTAAILRCIPAAVPLVLSMGSSRENAFPAVCMVCLLLFSKKKPPNGQFRRSLASFPPFNRKRAFSFWKKSFFMLLYSYRLFKYLISFSVR